MIAAQRRGLILEHLRREGAGSIASLADRIGVSASTIRRDLDYLTRTGHIERSHGGALLKERSHTTFEPAHEIGLHMAHAAKAKIGARAAALLTPGQSVIFDSSSTVLAAARQAVSRGLPLTACTNDLGIATALALAGNIHLVVLGGTVRPGSHTMIGDPVLTLLDRLHADMAFIGIHSLAGGRLSETSIDVAAVKRRMLACAGHTVLLADSTKFKHPAFCDVCAAGDVHTIITDDGVSASDRAILEEAGAAVIVAG